MPLLEAAGHEGIALDLPGHGRDRTPANRVTLESCVSRVLEAVDRVDEKPVLVAHSRNGIVISQAAEQRSERIAGLVYLAAYLVPPGKSMMDFAILDTESLVVQNVEATLDRKRLPAMIRAFRSPLVRRLGAKLLPLRMQTHALARAAYREALYHDCSDEITALANVLLEPEPNWAGFTPLELTPERYGRVRKVYVECLRDRAVTLKLQREMQRATPCDRVLSLDSGHSPFFSQPCALADAFVEALGVFEALALNGFAARSSAPRPRPSPSPAHGPARLHP
jgi:pimeloyl-ACP methyl ester carboxylesterase